MDPVAKVGGAPMEDGPGGAPIFAAAVAEAGGSPSPLPTDDDRPSTVMSPKPASEVATDDPDDGEVGTAALWEGEVARRAAPVGKPSSVD